MIRIKPGVTLDENELEFEYMRSPGPGGQNVNKVSTAVRLRFDAASSRSISQPVKKRLEVLAGNRMTRDGALLIEASGFRSRRRNRQDAIDRLTELLKKASSKPKPRRKTKPTLESQKKRLEIKKQRGMIKRQRKPVKYSEE